MTETSVNISRWNLSFNLGLLLKQLSKGLLLSLIIALGITGLSAWRLSQNPDFTTPEIVVAIVGILSTLAFLKAALMLLGYRFFNNTPFEGSFFVTALLVTLLLIIALGALSFIVGSHFEDFPTSELPWLLLASFVVVTVFLFVTSRVSYWVFNR